MAAITIQVMLRLVTDGQARAQLFARARAAGRAASRRCARERDRPAGRRPGEASGGANHSQAESCSRPRSDLQGARDESSIVTRRWPARGFGTSRSCCLAVVRRGSSWVRKPAERWCRWWSSPGRSERRRLAACGSRCWPWWASIAADADREIGGAEEMTHRKASKPRRG